MTDQDQNSVVTGGVKQHAQVTERNRAVIWVWKMKGMQVKWAIKGARYKVPEF